MHHRKTFLIIEMRNSDQIIYNRHAFSFVNIKIDPPNNITHNSHKNNSHNYLHMELQSESNALETNNDDQTTSPHQTSNIINVTFNDFLSFDILLKILNKFTNELTLIFDDTGIKIIVLNQSETTMIYIKLNIESFTNHQLPQNSVNVTFDLNNLLIFIFKIKKRNQIDKNTIFSIRTNDKNINFDFSNNEKPTLTYSLPILQHDDILIKLPVAPTFDKRVSFNSVNFFDSCNALYAFHNYVKIMCDENKLVFETIFETGVITKTYKNDENLNIKSDESSKNENINLIFNLCHLTKLNDLQKITSELTIFLRNNYPMFLSVPYITGKIIIGLSPVVETITPIKHLNTNSKSSN